MTQIGYCVKLERPDDAVAKTNPYIMQCSTNNSENNNWMSNNEVGEWEFSLGEFSIFKVTKWSNISSEKNL